jgi:tetratricopeptide (TPR) repeat protein
MHTSEGRPNDSRMWLALGGCFQAQDRIPDAISCFRNAEADDADGSCFLQLARIYQEMQDVKKAELYYKKVIHKKELNQVSTPQRLSTDVDYYNACLIVGVYAKQARRHEDATFYLMKVMDCVGSVIMQAYLGTRRSQGYSAADTQACSIDALVMRCMIS